MSKRLIRPQRKPRKSLKKSPAIWDLVMDDMALRKAFGKEKYGVNLQAWNGRDNLIDLYQELLDACVYIRTLIYEENEK